MSSQKMGEPGPSTGAALRTKADGSCGSPEVMSEVEGEDSEDKSVDTDRPSSVLWQRVIRQTIRIDLSDDESLHFNDLQGTFSICQSQDSTLEASFHLSENMEESNSHEESSLLDNRNTNQTDVTPQGLVLGGGVQSSEMKVSAQRPNTMEVSLAHSYEEAGDTSEEDQEDLPYDGDLSHDLGNTSGKQDCDTIDQSEREAKQKNKSPTPTAIVDSGSINQDTVDNTSPSLVLEGAGKPSDESARKIHCTDSRVTTAEGDKAGPEIFSHTRLTEAVGQSQTNDVAAHSNIKELLLQRFSLDELLNPSLCIEAETLPEVSFADSVDDTIMSMAPLSLKLGRDTSITWGDNNELEGEMKAPEGEHKQQDTESQGSEDTSLTGSDVAVSAADDSMERGWSGSAAPDNDGVQIQSSYLGRARSYNELKYGQGQVHYPLPDFSKVAPKVKIPKASAAKPNCHQPGILRVQSSPGMLGKSPASCKATVDLINKVLEDSIQPSETPYVFSDQPKQQDPPKSELVHHLQAEYDKLLTKYAEAENLIDQMRLGTKSQDLLDAVPFEGLDLLQVQVSENCAHQLNQPPKLSHPTSGGNPEDLNYPPLDPADQTQLSEGEKMTTELMDIISQYLQKVDDFKNGLNLMSIGISEQQMIFKSMMDAQDQLERNYIAKKEEHRALEMQNYMGLARNTGEFDPERKVEGEIFRFSMCLEDIRELIDRNVRSQLSPPASSSTPAPLQPSDTIFSSPPSVYEEPCCYSHNVGTVEDTVESHHVLGHVPQTCDDPSSASQCSGNTSASLPHLDVSLEGLGFSRRVEEEEEEANQTVGKVHDGTYLPLTPPSLQEASERSGTVLPWACGGSVTLSPGTQTQALLPQTQHVSQRTVTPETDSGFGGSDHSLPAAEQLPSPSETERSHLYSEQYSTPINTCGSDSDTSCSALQMTTVQNVLPWKQGEGLKPMNRVDHGIYGSEGTNIGLSGGESHTSRQPGKCGEDDHLVPPTQMLSLSNDWPSGHTAPSEAHGHTCSCHNEAISTLQLEVARLKQELEESLFQLPQITKRMDFLASRYKQEKRPKSRPWAHISASPNSGLRHSGYRHRKETLMNTDSNLFKVEDWISSDMDPNRGDSCQSVRQEHSNTFHQVGIGGDGRPHPCTDRRGKLCSARQSAAAEYVEMMMKPLQKPLLQVNYGSSYSLPAGFKAMEPQYAGQHRARSTQSDSALLPSNIYFQKPRGKPRTSSRTSGTSTYRGSEDEDIGRTLDRAIEAAQSMKRQTDRMAESLSADLAKAELQRKLRSLYPRRRRENSDS